MHKSHIASGVFRKKSAGSKLGVGCRREQERHNMSLICSIL